MDEVKRKIVQIYIEPTHGKYERFVVGEDGVLEIQADCANPPYAKIKIQHDGDEYPHYRVFAGHPMQFYEK